MRAGSSTTCPSPSNGWAEEPKILFHNNRPGNRTVVFVMRMTLVRVLSVKDAPQSHNLKLNCRRHNGWDGILCIQAEWGGIGVPPSFTQLAIKAISEVLILRDEIWWVAFSEVKSRHSVCTNNENDCLTEYRAATGGLKKWQQKWRQHY